MNNFADRTLSGQEANENRGLTAKVTARKLKNVMIVFGSMYWIRIAILLSVTTCAWWILNANGRTYETLDSLPYRYLPQSILENQTFRLDEYPQLNKPAYYSIVRDQTGHLISKKPAAVALIEIPFYLVTRWQSGGAPLSEKGMLRVGKRTACF